MHSCANASTCPPPREAMAEEVEIRPVETPEEYRACVELQERVWGRGFSQRVPTAILKVSRRLGGVVSGAWIQDRTLVGFVFGMTGWEDGVPVHWSDMLAVDPQFRDGGLGRRLKLHQRDELLGMGVRRMYWTFDPLESRNAYLNLERLGAVGRDYIRDMYGTSDSPLHRGIGTDRFLAVWEMDSRRVRSCLGEASPGGVPAGPDLGQPDSAGPEATESHSTVPDTVPRESGSDTSPPRRDGVPSPPVVLGTSSPDHPGFGGCLLLPGEPELDRHDPILAVSIPASIQELLEDDPEAAALWRSRTRVVLDHYLARGWVAAGVDRRGTVSLLRLVREEGVWSRPPHAPAG